ncbi:uncharacterized protein TNIN_99211 [Trichonephila inaurata madagascariensis]|uniref:DUF7041 domain-containing protein n=1 Tax=Trichonephila inaurata madagascariensis TaxID=2747483 RepID=A0A8X6X532_9ARAC|nr:uncharacterized protein TNIN_99211 [Trichonephila inaurata madagascariensis]
MNDVSDIKIPAYNFNDPALWFTISDSTFQLCCLKAITDSRTKFNYSNTHRTPEADTMIRDVIMNHDHVDPYKITRAKLIKQRSESSHQEIKKLFIREEVMRSTSQLIITCYEAACRIP